MLLIMLHPHITLEGKVRGQQKRYETGRDSGDREGNKKRKRLRERLTEDGKGNEMDGHKGTYCM